MPQSPKPFSCHRREAGIQCSRKNSSGMCFRETSQAQLAYVLSTFHQPLNEALKSYWDIITTQTGHYTKNVRSAHACKGAHRQTQSRRDDTHLQLNVSFFLMVTLGDGAAPAQHLTATSLRKMFLICSCHLIIHILPRLCRTILQDINSQLNPGLYHLWGQSSRSPRRCGDFLLTVEVI